MTVRLVGLGKDSKMKWISIKDSLPEAKYDSDGSVNCVVVYIGDFLHSNCPLVPFEIKNVEYAINHPEEYTLWAYITPPETLTLHDTDKSIPKAGCLYPEHSQWHDTGKNKCMNCGRALSL